MTTVPDAKEFPLRFTCSYQIYGDVNGLTYMAGLLGEAVSSEKIYNFNILSVETGAWGIQHALFSVDMQGLWVGDPDATPEFVKPVLTEILGEDDFTVLWVSNPSTT
jgi:hypothetical protein